MQKSNKEMNIRRIGAINWDAALPKETYFGSYMLKSLGNEKYCSRLPYFTIKTDNGYDFCKPSQAEYDKELEFAKSAGIDFFLYCWYPEDNGEEKTIGKEQHPIISGKLGDLNAKRKLYFSSKLENKPNMCAIVFDIHAYSESEIDSIILAMKDKYYEKINGRPLVAVYSNCMIQDYNGAVAAEINRRAKEEGLNPYFAVMAFADEDYVPEKREHMDAVTAYSVCRNAENYKELADSALRRNDMLLSFKLPVLPVISAGWNPMPRVDNPVSWYSYPRQSYAPLPDKDGFLYAFTKTDQWIEKNKEYADTGYAVVFAWNEFEEGGFLCPTLKKDGKADTSVSEAFYNAKEEYLNCKNSKGTNIL